MADTAILTPHDIVDLNRKAVPRYGSPACPPTSAVSLRTHCLSDIALRWVVNEATSVGLVVDDKRYMKQGVDVDRRFPDDHALGEIHMNDIARQTGWGWYRREIRPGTRCIHE